MVLHAVRVGENPTLALRTLNRETRGRASGLPQRRPGQRVIRVRVRREDLGSKKGTKAV